jgi:hypothetical protein
MRAEIRINHGLDRLLSNVLRAALLRGRDMAPAAGAPGDDSARPATVVADLLRQIRSHASWTGASVEQTGVGAIVRTSPSAWAYAAEIPVPPTLDTLREPHLRLRLRVEAGRMASPCCRQSTGKLLAEQVVSATQNTIPLALELPRGGPFTVIVRNTVDGESHGLLTEAVLCDRPRRAGPSGLRP